jgi:hypothetical protein
MGNAPAVASKIIVSFEEKKSIDLTGQIGMEVAISPRKGDIP